MKGNVTLNNWREKSYPIPVAGIEPMSFLDYPDKISAVLFLQGCPWACTYCHNASLQNLRVDESVMRPWSEIVMFLEKRKKILDAIVFSGGEPTIHRSLVRIMMEVQSMGYLIGLHTNGCSPNMIESLSLLELIDWVGIDLKGPSRLYKQITGSDIPVSNIWESIRIIQEKNILHQIRCTLCSELCNEEIFDELIYDAKQHGITKVVLQPCRDKNNVITMSKEELIKYQEKIDGELKYERGHVS